LATHSNGERFRKEHSNGYFLNKRLDLVTTRKDQHLAEFLLGDAELARDVVIAAHVAAQTDKTKFPSTMRKRLGGGRITAHYGTGEQLVQKHVLRFADTVAWVHEAKFFGVTRGNAFYTARSQGSTYAQVATAAFSERLAPISNKLLLRRYIASVMSSGNWPDTEFVAVAVATVVRNYPVDATRMSGITKNILGSYEASHYATTMRSKIRKHIKDRFSHLPSEMVEFGSEGLGIEHRPGTDAFHIVRESLAEMNPWDVPCYREQHKELTADHDFPARFDNWMHQNRGSSVQEGKGGWQNFFRPSKYPDEASRQTMFRAHALTCIDCFELIARTYAFYDKDDTGKPIRSSEYAMKLRFPVFNVEKSETAR
jgi:hypothetical protein